MSVESADKDEPSMVLQVTLRGYMPEERRLIRYLKSRPKSPGGRYWHRDSLTNLIYGRASIEDDSLISQQIHTDSEGKGPKKTSVEKASSPNTLPINTSAMTLD